MGANEALATGDHVQLIGAGAGKTVLSWTKNTVQLPALISCEGPSRISGISVSGTSALTNGVAFKSGSVGCALTDSQISVRFYSPKHPIGPGLYVEGASHFSATNLLMYPLSSTHEHMH